MRSNLTQRMVDRAPAVDALWWDTETRGLLLRLYASGEATYFFQYAVKDRRRRMVLGPAAGLTLHEARRQALALRAAVQAGRDPLAEREAEAEAAARRAEAKRAAVDAADAERLSALVPAYLDFKWRTLKRAARTVDEQARLWHRDLAPVLGTRRASEVTRRDVRTLMQGMADRPVLANRCLFLLTSFYNWAMDHEHVPETMANPCARIPKYPETPRERRITATEWKRLRRAWQVVRRRREAAAQHDSTPGTPVLVNTVDLDVLHFLALTGWRKREAFGLTWEMVDRLAMTATLARTKTGRSVRYLSPEALAVVLARPRLGPFVFPSPVTASRPLADPRATWDAIRTVARVADVTLHDLRRHVASVAAELGLAYEVRQALLGHKATGMTAQYTIVSPDVLRAAAAQLGAELVRLATHGAHDPAGPVIPVTRPRRA